MNEIGTCYSSSKQKNWKCLNFSWFINIKNNASRNRSISTYFKTRRVRNIHTQTYLLYKGSRVGKECLKILNNYIAEFYDKTLYFKNKAWPQTGVLLYTGMLSQPMTNWQITPPPQFPNPSPPTNNVNVQKKKKNLFKKIYP